ncbi:MAG: hypothetical protein SCH70_00060 [Candidatus Methanoperedens sp.]|nr:hypothetical protein [Candidatus Methanoperedens sp.]
MRKVEIANRLPFIRKYAELKVRNYFTQKHAGQVVSLEDAVSILTGKKQRLPIIVVGVVYAEGFVQ